MQRKTRTLLLVGALLFGALVLVFHGSTSVSAATYGYIENYNAGYNAGYNDCSNGVAFADNWGHSQAYIKGYGAGYQFCEQQRQTGSDIGSQAGHNAGYQKCVSEYQTPPPGSGSASTANPSFDAPLETGIDQSYSDGFAAGYHECRIAHGNNP